MKIVIETKSVGDSMVQTVEVDAGFTKKGCNTDTMLREECSSDLASIVNSYKSTEDKIDMVLDFLGEDVEPSICNDCEHEEEWLNTLVGMAFKKYVAELPNTTKEKEK